MATPIRRLSLPILLSLTALLVVPPPGSALAADEEMADQKPDSKTANLPERVLPPDMSITKTDRVTIRGEPVPYRVTTGTQPVYGEDGRTIAALHYTYYERTDVTDTARRPFFVSFNGGPGSGSL